MQEPHCVIKSSSSSFPASEWLQLSWEHCHGSSPKPEANPNLPRGRLLLPTACCAPQFSLHQLPPHSQGKASTRQRGDRGPPRVKGASVARGQFAEASLRFCQAGPTRHCLMSRATVASFEFKSVLWNLNHRNTHHHKKPPRILLTKQEELLPMAEK